MQFRKRYLLLIPGVLLLGCSGQQEEAGEVTAEIERLNSQIAELQGTVNSLRQNLGAYQYHGVDPQLSISVSDVVFEVSRVSRDYPEVSFTAEIRQNNPEFPLQHYGVNFLLSVLDDEGNELDTVFINQTLESDAMSVDVEQVLYTIFYDPEVTYRLVPKEYYWFPDVTYSL